jgi:phosphoribosylglycinamide formyltransferase 2
MEKFLLLGAGELGKEFAISAKRYGFYVIAIDHYPNAPAMQIADESEVIDMLDGSELDNVIDRYKPDYIVPEVEALCVERLYKYETDGYTVVPSAKAVNTTMNRKKTRELANSLGFTTARYTYATSVDELKEAAEKIGYPCVIKPLMSSSGKGQSILKTKEGAECSWINAMQCSRGNIPEVIVEEFIEFDFEITLLTITSENEDTKYCETIMHTQINGDFRESWQPCFREFNGDYKRDAQEMAANITKELGGNGVWGVEFFVSKDRGVIFSELSPRPHDTGMVTMSK